MPFAQGSSLHLNLSFSLLPEGLKKLGYKTHAVGKWHLGQSKEEYLPTNRGFKHFYGLLGGGFNHITKQSGQGRYDFWRNQQPEYDNTTHSTTLINAEALKIVTKHATAKSSNPFFLYLSHPAPHDPLQAPQKYQDMCNHIPSYRRRMSCAMVAMVDEGFGQLIKVLRETGELENTIIAFSTDNGGVPYAGALNYPNRGGKSTTYEGGVKVPGFIYAPKQIGGNINYGGLFHVSDFFPTFMAMINATHKIEKSQELNGLNQLPSLIKKEQTGVRQSVHIHRDIDRDSQAYRRGPWKVMVGHHFLPLIFNRIYNETKSGWLVEGGTWRDKAMEILMAGMDLIAPPCNTIFLQYILWVTCDSFNVGGLQSTQNVSSGLMQDYFKSDLGYWKSRDGVYPTVSLFNLEEDPQETTNLASKHPDLVETLLAEAEKEMKNAPSMFRGDVIYNKSPRGPDAGWTNFVTHLGSEHPRVIPFGPFLPADFKMEEANEDDFQRLFDTAKPEAYSMILQMFLVYIVLPLILLRRLLKRLK